MGPNPTRGATSLRSRTPAGQPTTPDIAKTHLRSGRSDKTRLVNVGQTCLQAPDHFATNINLL